MANTKQPGELRKTSDGFAVTFERFFPYDPITVWDAITNPEKLALWFFKVTIDLVPGGKMVIHFQDEEQTVNYARIIRVEPGKVFEFAWENTDGPDELATWELFPEGSNGCKLLMTYSRLADKYAVSVPTGWHVMLDHLEEVLQGRREPFPNTTEWTGEQIQLRDQYARIWYQQFPPFRLSEQYGTVRKTGEGYDIVFERLLPHPVEEVWQAITTPEKLALWLGGPAEIDLKTGGKVRIGLLMTTVEGVITRLEKDKLLEYTWGSPDNTVRFELYPADNDQCRLIFTETGVTADSLTEAVPGWHGYLDFLGMVLDGGKMPAFPLDGWPEIAKAVKKKYQAILPAV